MTKVPLLIVGDGPAEPTGLGRIARDLVAQIVSSDLPLDVVQLGGMTPPVWRGWRHYPLDRSDDWGAAHTAAYWRDLWGNQPGILWVIWDPGRLLPFCQIDLPVQRWTYSAIDATNCNGEITGPAGDALRLCDRVLAYGRWGSERLKARLPQAISYLPHGLVLSTFGQPISEQEHAWTAQVLGPHIGRRTLIGAVATNQPRKDLSMFCATLAELRKRGMNVHGWLHTDVLVKAWSIPELILNFELQKHLTVTTDAFTDRELACLYQRCAFTIAPGLGEGFCYPLVESLAAGVPVLHTDFGGGAELIPKTEWRIPVREKRLDGIYASQRPVHRAEDWANAAERLLQWKNIVGADVCAAYCRGAVAHLSWPALWPRWYAWIKQGLES